MVKIVSMDASLRLHNTSIPWLAQVTIFLLYDVDFWFMTVMVTETIAKNIKKKIFNDML